MTSHNSTTKLLPSSSWAKINAARMSRDDGKVEENKVVNWKQIARKSTRPGVLTEAHLGGVVSASITVRQ